MATELKYSSIDTQIAASGDASDLFIPRILKSPTPIRRPVPLRAPDRSSQSSPSNRTSEGASRGGTRKKKSGVVFKEVDPRADSYPSRIEQPEMETDISESLSLYLDELRNFPHLGQDQVVHLLKYIRAEPEESVAEEDHWKKQMKAIRDDSVITTGAGEDHGKKVEKTLAETKNPKNFLFKSYSHLVVGVAKGFKRGTTGVMTMQDLIQEGNMALLDAIDSYNPGYISKKTKKPVLFFSYAKQAVTNRMFRGIDTQEKTVHIPAVYERGLRVARKFSTQYYTEHGKYPDQATIYHWMRNNTKMKDNEISRSLSLLDNPITQVYSLDRPRTVGEDAVTLADVTPSPHQNTARQALDDIQLTYFRELIENEVAKLTPAQQKVMRLRLGIRLPDSFKQAEAADIIETSRQNVQQTERAVYDKWRSDAKFIAALESILR